MTSASQLRPTLSGDLARAVAQIVNDDELHPGDQLDTVKTLAARFDVVVPTMREALRRLEGLGMLEFRHGSGIYVGANAGRRVLANPVSQQPDHDQLIELLQARLQIEPQVARLAAQVRQPAGLTWMNGALERARLQVAEQDEALWLTNLDIHRAIAAASGNGVLVEVLDSIMLIHADAQREILRLHGDAVEDYAEHATIVQAVHEGDYEAAGRASHRHLEHVVEAIRAQRDSALVPSDPPAKRPHIHP